MKQFFIGEQDFRVWLPNVAFIEKGGDDANAFDSRKISGIMSTERRDRQGEVLLAKGLDFSEFLKAGHFNDNHSQETSAIVGYPTNVKYHDSLREHGIDAPGWTCEGYVLKGTKRSDAIWELAAALASVPNRKLGFSVEGRVERRADKTIEKAMIKNVAITNCPVNTDCTWELMAKSFADPELAVKAMMAGGAVAVPGSTGGTALQTESLDGSAKNVAGHDEKKKKRKKKIEEALKSALSFDDLLKAVDVVLERRPDFSEEAAAYFVKRLYQKGLEA